jgi:hypothetical protein
MYQHGRAGLDATFANFIEEQLVSPKLLESVSRLRTDGHLFESLVELVHKHGRLNDAFALRLSQQIARLCATTNHEAFFALDEPVRKTIGLLVANTPLPLWTTLGRFYEVATPRERHWLEILVGPNRHDFDGLGHNGAGRLFWIDEELLVSWAKHDPGNRAPFLCTFYPVLLLQENGPATWNPALERIAMEFGRATEFQDALARRLYPSSWSGSIVPLLEVYLEPLTSWFNHPIGELSLWARKTHRNLQKQIAWERKRDQEE